MAAPQIPNLLDNLKASKAGRGRKIVEQLDHGISTNDKIVQQTDDDAAGSRLSAVDAGYLHDPYARPFSNVQGSVRRMPIINRGTYARTTAIDILIKRFLAVHDGNPTQIVSLGAGTDTRFFRLLDEKPDLAHTLAYHELDFPTTTKKKVACIERTPAAIAVLRKLPARKFGTASSTLQIALDKTSLASPAYHVHAVDLRNLASVVPQSSSALADDKRDDESVTTAESSPLTSIASNTPTLILAECCLTYLDTTVSGMLLRYFTRALIPEPTPLAIVLYEPINPHDAFGRTMRQNLSARGIALHGLQGTPTLVAHKERLHGVGFDKAQGLEIRQVWDQWISHDEKDRLRKVEGLDEEEEWMLLAGHYGIIWGSRGMKRDAFGTD